MQESARAGYRRDFNNRLQKGLVGRCRLTPDCEPGLTAHGVSA